MHFYPFNIGDYATATAHLEPLEDIAYRRLMDLYYSTEKPIPECLNKTARLIRMRTHSECIAVVLEEFFTLECDGYHCDRIDVELFKFHEKSEKASKSAKSRWKKAKQNQKVKALSERNANALKTHSECNAKQEPINNKQETVNTIKDPLVQSKIDRVKFVSEAFSYFWSNMFLPKKAKPVGEKSFNKVVKTYSDPMHFAKWLVTDTETRFNNQQIGFDKMHPSTYLNQARWEDDHTIDKPQNEKVKMSGGGDWAKYGEETF